MHIIFDIGGTNMRIAASEDGADFLGEPLVYDTPEKFDDGMALLTKSIRELSGGKSVTRIIGGIAGPFSKEKGMLVNAPNLSGWIEKPIASELESAFSTSVHIENDAALAALGEAVHGAGKDSRIVAYLTAGTGLGGARVVDKKIDAAVVGFEPGRQIVSAEHARKNESGMYLTDYVSGKALERRFGTGAENITDEAAWNDFARMLAYGANNAIVHWSPDVVVLGGSVMLKSPDFVLGRVRDYLSGVLHIFPDAPAVRKAALGDMSGLYGGLSLSGERT